MTDVSDRLKAALSDRYAIEQELGAGGMATVYLAEDLKHHREVAIKVLRPELTAVLGPERFLKEIEVTAHLQHPHILPLFDSGEADSFLYYVMPYVEGESLREKLNREKQLAIEESIEIARGVASALDYAHRHEVIHRDIKPENILIHDGQPVVADFGIALAVSAAAGTRLTETGLSVGTPHYMSPEQASADRELDGRTDVYSLGATLYEMLAGQPPFVAASAQAVVSKILTEQPAPVTVERQTVPPHVEAAIHKALAKLPADRFTSASDFSAALSNPTFTLPTPPATVATTAMPRAQMLCRLAVALGATSVVLAALALWGWLRPGTSRPVARYGLAFPAGQEMVDELHPTFDIAPDGAWIVYVGPGEGGGRLWVKLRDQFEATPLPGTEGARGPSVSPDGAWISFTVGGQLRKVPSGGGPVVTLVDAVSTLARTPAAWLDDGTLAFIDPALNLSRVLWEGGPPEILLPSDTLYSGFATPLPGSHGLLVGRCDYMCQSYQGIWVLDLGTGALRELVTDALTGEYIPSGHVLYVREDGGLFALPFDLSSLEATGAAIPVLGGIKVDGGVAPDIALSQDGTMLMMMGPSVAAVVNELEAVWIDREGGVMPVDADWRFRAARNTGWALSPDGNRLAIGLNTEEGDDIWIKELDDGPLTRLTFHEAEDARPRWTIDGQSVMFFSFSRRADERVSDLYVKRADGTGPVHLLLAAERDGFDVSPSSQGDWLALRLGGTTGLRDRDIWGFRPGVDSTLVPLLCAESYDEMAPVVSPDGRFLAYVSNESGREEVYVRPFPDVESERWSVSIDGGHSPLWAHAGGELFYLTPDNLMISAVVETSPAFRVTARNILFGLGPGYILAPEYFTTYDISPDDQRFLMARSVQDPRSAGVRMILVQNFFEQLKQKVGPGND